MKDNKKCIDLDIYNLLEDLISFSDTRGKILECNDAFASFSSVSKDSIIGNYENTLFNSNYTADSHNDSEDNKEVLVYEEIITIHNEIKIFDTKRRFLYDGENVEGILTIRKDITQNKEASVLYQEDKKILKHIAQGDNLLHVLNEVIKSAEKMKSDMRCSILLLDKSGKRLFSAAAPSIPEFFTKKVDGMKIGEDVGSCGAAAYLKKRIIVEDISEHDNWGQAKNLALKAGLQACWSQPILSSKGEVLGTFAMYYNHPKKPTEFDLHVIEDRASIAGIAIEKHKNEYQIQRNLEREKKQEELLMHKSKQAMMGEMLENIAHQWRQPLSVISTSATGLKVKKELGILDDALEHKALESINENAQYLSQTIDDFRNYFKSDNIEVKFNIKEAFENTLTLIDITLKSKSVNVISDIHNIVLFTLENELTQVFMNILNNSVDELAFLDEEERFIYVQAYQDKNNAVIKIIDSAKGAKEEIINRIFEPYFTTKHQSNGTGIGLYMCKEIIEKHMKGTIEARNNSFIHENKEYHGLEFVITLPI